MKIPFSSLCPSRALGSARAFAAASFVYDADFTVVLKAADEFVPRTSTEKDSAYFFKFK